MPFQGTAVAFAVAFPLTFHAKPLQLVLVLVLVALVVPSIAPPDDPLEFALAAASGSLLGWTCGFLFKEGAERKAGKSVLEYYAAVCSLTPFLLAGSWTCQAKLAACATVFLALETAVLAHRNPEKTPMAWAFYATAASYLSAGLVLRC